VRRWALAYAPPLTCPVLLLPARFGRTQSRDRVNLPVALSSSPVLCSSPQVTTPPVRMSERFLPRIGGVPVGFWSWKVFARRSWILLAGVQTPSIAEGRCASDFASGFLFVHVKTGRHQFGEGVECLLGVGPFRLQV